MPTFSKFIEGQRASQQLEIRTGTSTPERSLKIQPTKCPCHTYLTLSDNSLSLGSKSHNQSADNAAPQKRVVPSNLKQKAAEQPLSVSQNLLSEVLAESTSESNQTLPNIESLARVVQRSRAKASGSAQHMLLCFSHLSQLLMFRPRRCSTK